MLRLSVDLNCDMGESFGPYRHGADGEVISFISSANIACGFHGGDPSVMRNSVALARNYGVAVGAHVGFPDLLGFGRRNLQVRPAELKDYVTYQVGALQAIAKAQGLRVLHVKPHGAMYMMALEDEQMSRAILEAVIEQDETLSIYTIEDSATFLMAGKLGLRTVSEFFADRGYRSDGTVKMFDWNLDEAGGTPEAIGARVARLILTGKVAAMDGTEITMRPQTVCVHSDTPRAPEIVRAIRDDLKNAGIDVKAP
jgi:5-oxoprolinase (ATP-hydrolysing) subunit A